MAERRPLLLQALNELYERKRTRTSRERGQREARRSGVDRLQTL